MTVRRKVGPVPPSDELRARLGMNMRKARKQLSISQHELGFRAEVHPAAISPLELGEVLPKIETFIRLAGALEVTPGDLTAGILWLPPKRTVVPGNFEVPSDPARAAEAAALREASPGRRRRK